MTRLAAISAALRAACCASGVPAEGVTDIADNLAMAVYYGFDGTIEALVAGTVDRRLSAREASSFVLPANFDVVTLERELVEAALEFRQPCGCWALDDRCSDCEAA